MAALRCRALPEGTVLELTVSSILNFASSWYLRGVLRRLRSDAYCLLLLSTSSLSVWCCCSPLAPMYLALVECGSRVVCCGLYQIRLLVVGALYIKRGEILFGSYLDL